MKYKGIEVVCEANPRFLQQCNSCGGFDDDQLAEKLEKPRVKRLFDIRVGLASNGKTCICLCDDCLAKLGEMIKFQCDE